MEPVTGGLGAILSTVGNLMLGMVDIPIDVAKAVAVKSTAGSLGGPGADRSSTSIIGLGRSIDGDQHDNSPRGVDTDISSVSYQFEPNNQEAKKNSKSKITAAKACDLSKKLSIAHPLTLSGVWFWFL